MTHTNFTILNSHVTVIYLRFIKSTNFYAVKQKHVKWLYFFLLFILSSEKTVSKIKWLLPESYISKSVKMVESITCRKDLKYILAIDEESKKNLVLVTLGPSDF